MMSHHEDSNHKAASSSSSASSRSSGKQAKTVAARGDVKVVVAGRDKSHSGGANDQLYPAVAAPCSPSRSKRTNWGGDRHGDQQDHHQNDHHGGATSSEEGSDRDALSTTHTTANRPLDGSAMQLTPQAHHREHDTNRTSRKRSYGDETARGGTHEDHEDQEDHANFVHEVGPDDVLLGRGGLAREHSGNVSFRVLVRGRKAEYMRTNNRKMKNQIARGIISAIRARHGRFLDKVTTRHGEEVYVEADSNIVLEKTKQALRHNDRQQSQQQQQQQQQQPMLQSLQQIPPSFQQRSQDEAAAGSQQGSSPLYDDHGGEAAVLLGRSGGGGTRGSSSSPPQPHRGNLGAINLAAQSVARSLGLGNQTASSEADKNRNATTGFQSFPILATPSSTKAPMAEDGQKEEYDGGPDHQSHSYVGGKTSNFLLAGARQHKGGEGNSEFLDLHHGQATSMQLQTSLIGQRQSGGVDPVTAVAAAAAVSASASPLPSLSARGSLVGVRTGEGNTTMILQQQQQDQLMNMIRTLTSNNLDGAASLSSAGGGGGGQSAVNTGGIAAGGAGGVGTSLEQYTRLQLELALRQQIQQQPSSSYAAPSSSQEDEYRREAEEQLCQSLSRPEQHHDLQRRMMSAAQRTGRSTMMSGGRGALPLAATALDASSTTAPLPDDHASSKRHAGDVNGSDSNSARTVDAMRRWIEATERIKQIDALLLNSINSAPLQSQSSVSPAAIPQASTAAAAAAGVSAERQGSATGTAGIVSALMGAAPSSSVATQSLPSSSSSTSGAAATPSLRATNLLAALLGGNQTALNAQMPASQPAGAGGLHGYMNASSRLPIVDQSFPQQHQEDGRSRQMLPVDWRTQGTDFLSSAAATTRPPTETALTAQEQKDGDSDNSDTLAKRELLERLNRIRNA